MAKLKRDDRSETSTRVEVSSEVDEFYGRLYKSSDISLFEIRMVLKQLKNNKGPGKDGITSELLKAGGSPDLKF